MHCCKAESLYQKLTNALPMARTHKQAFETLDVPIELVNQWQSTSTAPVKKCGEWHSIYWPRGEKGECFFPDTMKWTERT